MKISSLGVRGQVKTVFNARVEASSNLRFSRMASMTGTLRRNDKESRRGVMAPQATTAFTFSSLPNRLRPLVSRDIFFFFLAFFLLP